MTLAARAGYRVRASLLVATVLLTGCGMNPQTSRPYTPADGVNTQVAHIKVRNVLIVANASGAGVLSATLVSSAPDELSSVAGVAQQGDGSPAGMLTVSAKPVPVPANTPVVLTNGTPPIKVSSPALKPGLTANVVLTFKSGAQATLVAPVLDAALPEYRGLPIG